MPRPTARTSALQPPQPVAWTLVALVLLLFVALIGVLIAKGYQQVRQGGSVSLMAVESGATETTAIEPRMPRPAPMLARTDGPAESVPGIAVRELPVEEQEVATFNGRPLRAVRELTMKVTAYSPDARSCGKWADGNTASGYSVWTNGMKLVAADTDLLPFHSIVSIPGYHGGRPVPVLDRGGVIKGNRLDVLYPTHERALEWGVQDLTVTVWEYAD